MMAYPTAEALPKNCVEKHASGDGQGYWCIAGWWKLSSGQSVYVGRTKFRWARQLGAQNICSCV